MAKRPHLSVVIPAYNEEINLKRGVLSHVWEYLKAQDYSWEVLIMNDASKDNTAKIVSDLVKKHSGFKLFNEPHRGKGGTVVSGLKKATGEIVMFSDMDQATPIGELEKILPEFTKGVDVVIGSRAGREGTTLIRKAMAYGFVFLRNVILRLPFKDTQCGFKAFTKDAAERIIENLVIFNQNGNSKSASVTAGFDLEILYVARKLKLKIKEVPVEWHEYGERKEVSPIKDSWEGLRDLLKIRLYALRGKYKVTP